MVTQNLLIYYLLSFNHWGQIEIMRPASKIRIYFLELLGSNLCDEAGEWLRLLILFPIDLLYILGQVALVFTLRLSKPLYSFHFNILTSNLYMYFHAIGISESLMNRTLVEI